MGLRLVPIEKRLSNATRWSVVCRLSRNLKPLNTIQTKEERDPSKATPLGINAFLDGRVQREWERA